MSNNPLTHTDPTGHDSWLIHGTWSYPSTWKKNFREYVSDLFHEDVHISQWSGGNDKEARSEAANKISQDIIEWKKEHSDEPIRLIGHSHGGNVAISVANILAKEGISVETLITIATPVRKDYQLNEDAKVGQHIQVYNSYDDVQINGGQYPDNLGIADRRFSDAQNVEVALPWYKRNTAFGLLSNHSYMHSNVDVWKQYIAPLIYH